MTTSWNALYDKLIVRRAPEVTHIAGLEVPDQAREKQNVGTVVKRGAGRPCAPYLMQNADTIVPLWFTTIPLTVAEGDEVLFNKFAGFPLEGDDPDLVVLREDEILAYRKPTV